MNKQKPVNIYDISKKAGVSIATVSRVINGSDRVSAATRDKVLSLMKELDYSPNAFARGLGKGSMQIIGILCADVKDIYLATAVSFLERELRQNGFQTVLNCTGYNYKDKVQSMKTMLERRADAVILVGSHYIEESDAKNKYIKDAANFIPVMILNGFIKGANIFCNLTDDYTSFYEATRYLIDEGRKHILYIHRERTYSEKKKFEGYKDALTESGLGFDEDYVLGVEGDIYRISEAIEEKLVTGKLPCDAILAVVDEIAVGALKYADLNHIKVPQKLSVIGCNNSFVSICSQPELTSIDNKCEMMCVNTVTTLVRVLEGKTVSHKNTMEGECIFRGTTLNKTIKG